MRLLIIALSFIAMLFPAFAMAETAEGFINDIDIETNQIRLDDGQLYQMPSEINLQVLSPGMKVILFYDIIDGENLVNMIEPQDVPQSQLLEGDDLGDVENMQ